jgi:acyl carrier protein phosphodiesterase
MGSRGTDPGAPCPSHKFRNLGYVATSEDADRRVANGERQRRCPVCLRWIWRSEFGPGWEQALPDLALDALIDAQRLKVTVSEDSPRSIFVENT